MWFLSGDDAPCVGWPLTPLFRLRRLGCSDPSADAMSSSRGRCSRDCQSACAAGKHHQRVCRRQAYFNCKRFPTVTVVVVVLYCLGHILVDPGGACTRTRSACWGDLVVVVTVSGDCWWAPVVPSHMCIVEA